VRAALVLSASLDPAEIARAIESGAAATLDKTAELDELVDRVPASAPRRRAAVLGSRAREDCSFGQAAASTRGDKIADR
jgi:DNA-binding NarL/FixJ family response regulator